MKKKNNESRTKIKKSLVKSSPADMRDHWVRILTKVADPVLKSFAEGRFKKDFPFRGAKIDESSLRSQRFEALGRLLCGLAPWLEGGSEGKARIDCARGARYAVDRATDPNSPDYLEFDRMLGTQPIVDAAYLAYAFIQAPKTLWEPLSASTRNNVIKAMGFARRCPVQMQNKLLFAAMVETFLSFAKADWDALRVECAFKMFEGWYKGDGAYGDGQNFHHDYYNSYVMLPMQVGILDYFAEQKDNGREISNCLKLRLELLRRAGRYATVLAYQIAPDGSYPPVGRSITYRCGAFFHLAQTALHHRLEAPLTPSQVRCGLDAVIQKTMEAPGTFDKDGWLNIGLYGHQPLLGESYIRMGSEYFCTMGFSPLGLPETDPFWMDPDADWPAKAIWSGKDIKADHYMKEEGSGG